MMAQTSTPDPLAMFNEVKGLHLLTEATPNGKKVQIVLEELQDVYGTTWHTHLIDLDTNEQKRPWFLALNPNGRIPVLVDSRTFPHVNVWESSAILVYLQEHVDTRLKFGFGSIEEKSGMLQWLFFWHAAAPVQGQLRRFSRASAPVPHETERLRIEMLRIYSVIEDHLAGKHTGQARQYLAGNGLGRYSVADMGTWPHARAYKSLGFDEQDMSRFPQLLAWIGRIADRPAVQRGISDKYDSEEHPELVLRAS